MPESSTPRVFPWFSCRPWQITAPEAAAPANALSASEPRLVLRRRAVAVSLSDALLPTRKAA